MANRQLAPLPLAPFRLAPWFSPRPWGTMDLSPWYDLQPKEPIGEAWLTGHDCLVETGEHAGRRLGDVAAEYGEALLGGAALTDYPLLLKILFPHDKLSVQVHPDDSMAQTMGEPRGKTECWYVLESSPGASIDLGLKPGVDIAAVRSAIAGHTLEDLLEKVPVERGEMVFVDAGTVHAIGPGVTLLEDPAELRRHLSPLRTMAGRASCTSNVAWRLPGSSPAPVRCPFSHTEQESTQGSG